MWDWWTAEAGCSPGKLRARLLRIALNQRNKRPRSAYYHCILHAGSPGVHLGGKAFETARTGSRRSLLEDTPDSRVLDIDRACKGLT
jgi:hypothetical protein